MFGVLRVTPACLYGTETLALTEAQQHRLRVREAQLGAANSSGEESRREEDGRTERGDKGCERAFRGGWWRTAKVDGACGENGRRSSDKGSRCIRSGRQEEKRETAIEMGGVRDKKRREGKSRRMLQKKKRATEDNGGN